MLVDSSFMKEPFIPIFNLIFKIFICSPSARLSPIIQIFKLAIYVLTKKIQIPELSGQVQK